MNAHIATLAREAGFYDTEIKGWSPQIEALVTLVVMDCAEIVDTTDIQPGKDFAKAIRERYWVA